MFTYSTSTFICCERMPHAKIANDSDIKSASAATTYRYGVHNQPQTLIVSPLCATAKKGEHQTPAQHEESESICSVQVHNRAARVSVGYLHVIEWKHRIEMMQN